MFVLPNSCIRLDAADNLSPSDVHRISQFAPRTQFLAAAVVAVPQYVLDLELDGYLQTTYDEQCPQVVVLRGLASFPFALQGDDTPSDLDKVRPNPVTLIVLFRSYATSESDAVASKGRDLQLRIPGSTVHPYARIVRVCEFETDAILVHDVITYPRNRSEQPQVTTESLWATIDALARQKGLRLGPWGLEHTLWLVWRELVEQNLLCPVLVWMIEDETPLCNQTILLRRQAHIGTDSVLWQSYVSSRPCYCTVIESVLDRGVETNEAKARWELQLEAQSLHLEEGDQITAEIVLAEVRESEESVNQ
ncbi:MAG: hypothetical protein IPH49_09020 [Ignavibacteria bacterium]|nr:hypothetical protein [Ignavibacteria bacterium]